MKINLSHAAEEVKISKNDLEAQGASVANDINSSFGVSFWSGEELFHFLCRRSEHYRIH